MRALDDFPAAMAFHDTTGFLVYANAGARVRDPRPLSGQDWNALQSAVITAYEPLEKAVADG